VRCHDGAGTANAAAAAQAAGGKEESDDDQIHGPATKGRSAPFKPGTSTWDTDDAKEAARKIGKRALIAQKAAERSEKKAKHGLVNPAMWWQEHYTPQYKESTETVGLTSRSVTSTTSAIAPRNEHIQKLMHRCNLLHLSAWVRWDTFLPQSSVRTRAHFH
jgi:hypothetical protein